MSVKVTFEQRVTSYVSLPQGAESVYNALVRDHHVGGTLPQLASGHIEQSGCEPSSFDIVLFVVLS